MKALVILPVLATLVAIGVPLMRYAEKQRQDGESIGFLQTFRSAQETHRAGQGEYARDIGRLGLACPRVMTCEIAMVERDYYIALMPATSWSPSQHAYAMRSDGRIFLFFDGVAPKPADMEIGGLATPLDGLGQFKIP